MAALTRTLQRLSIAQTVLLVFLAAALALGGFLYAISNTLIQTLVTDLATKEARLASELIFQGLYGAMRAGWSEAEVEGALELARRNLPGASVDVVRSAAVASLFGDSERAREQRLSSTEISHVMSTGQELVLVEDGQTIQFFFPFVAKHECLSCHTNVVEGHVNGVARITVPLSTLSLPLRAALSGVIQVLAALTIVMLMLQLFVARRLLVRPIMQLTDHILQVRRTESLAERISPRNTPKGFLELHLLAQSFDALMDDLADSQTKLREQAEHDDLTGLLNRRAFNRDLLRELARAKRYTHSIAIFVIDLDNFKCINDNFGHAAGDEVLKRCSDCLRHNVRENDVLARLGGDELAIAAPEMDRAAATLLREKLKRILEQTETPYQGDRLRIGASIGVAIYPWDGHSPQRLLKRADTCMYEEKRRKKAASATP